MRWVRHSLTVLRCCGLGAGEPLMTEESIEHMAGVVEAKGTDAFWQLPIEELLPAALQAEAPR